MLKRKINQQLAAWKKRPNHQPLIIKGVRQCGKTASVLDFAHSHYAHTVYLNFFENPQYAEIFQNSLSVDTLTMLMSVQLPDAVFEPGSTVIILDEIQECPEARTALKFFSLDGRYDVIATGSLLGVSGYGTPKSIPVGYEQLMIMYPMDFEEFLWAQGIKPEVIGFLRTCLEKEQPVPSALHEKMRELLKLYTIVGGMPAVVQSFVERHNLQEVFLLQRNIIHSYEDDMVKYAENRDKGRIRQCFASIPRQLAKENKKFQYSVVESRGNAQKFSSSLQWIEDAGIICRCYNLSLPDLPLEGYAVDNIFKVYMADTGLFVSMLEDGTQSDILHGNMLGYKGAIYENLAADFFHKMGRKLYYFHKDSGLEIDFVIRLKGKATLVEVKATNGYAKSLKTILSQPERYPVNQGIKLADTQLNRQGKILNLPFYMGFLLTEV